MNNEQLFRTILIALLLAWIVGLIAFAVLPPSGTAEGEAKAALIQTVVGLDIPPEQAKYVTISVNLTEVEISMEEAKIQFFGE